MRKEFRKIRIVECILLICILSISSFLCFNHEKAYTSVKELAHQLYLSSVDVSNIEVSTILIDVTNGNTQYNSSYEWNATSPSDIRNIIYQVNYKKNDASLSYSAGQLELTVDNALYLFEGVRPNIANSVIHAIDISADLSTNSNKQHEWSYKYSNDYKKIIFTNNNDIEVNANFEGSIQISYLFTPFDMYKSINQNLETKLNNSVTSNNINFKFTANKRDYQMTETTKKVDSLDGLPSGDYIWVKSIINVSQTNGGLRFAWRSFGSNNNARLYYEVPDNVLVVDSTLKQLSRDENNRLYSNYSGGHVCETLTSVYTTSICLGFETLTYYIGIPRNEYYDNAMNYSVTVEGIYSKQNENDTIDSDNEGFEELCKTNKSVIASNFEFSYSGELYKIEKKPSTDEIDVSYAREGESYTYFSLKASSIYYGTTYDFKIGDDVLLLNDDTLRILNDNEYNINSILFPNGNSCTTSHGSLHSGACLKNGNDAAIAENKYDVDLYVRYANSNEYVLYETFKNKKRTFENFPNSVVGFYFYIHDVKESINFSTYIKITLNITDVNDEATLTNFDYLEIYTDDKVNPVNTPSNSSYNSTITQALIRTYDSNTYHRNVQRGVATNYISNQKTIITNYLRFNNFTNVDDKKYISTLNPYFELGGWITENYYYSNNYIGYENYSLLPEGLYYDSSKEIKVSLTTSYYINRYFKKSDGTHFSNNEYLELIKNHVRYEVINNWHDTNRTMVVIIVDLSDCPLDLRDARDHDGTYIEEFNIPVYTTVDDMIEVGNTFKAVSYTKPYGSKYTTRGKVFMLDPDVDDINSDGDKTELIWDTSKSASIIYSSASNQDLTDFVKTDKNNYSSKNGNVSLNTNYTYKLRARNANNKITNLVIYDNLENNIKQNGEFVLARGDKEAFKGTFVGVDTSYAEAQGYKVKVYYSELNTPGSLGSDTSWKTYTTSVDKTKVKSLAFEYLNSSNNKAIIPENTLTYVEVVMKSPNTNAILRTYNGSWVEWNALDTNDQIITDIVGINSNVVSVTLPSTLRVKHLKYRTNEVLATEENREYFIDDEYSTSQSSEVSDLYRFRETAGDAPNGVISKNSYEITYYYESKEPVVKSKITKTGPTSINNRTDLVSYNYVVNPEDNYLLEYFGDSTLIVKDTLPYKIDLSKSNLSGGVYDDDTKTITWTYPYSADADGKTYYSKSVDYSVVYKDIPIEETQIVNNIKSTIRYGTKESFDNDSSSTTVNEKYKLLVRHLDFKTGRALVSPVETEKSGNEYYETDNIVPIPDDYELKIRPLNYAGYIRSAVTEVIYYYERKNPNITSTITKTGTANITSVDDIIDYNIVYSGSYSDYIGNATVTVVDKLPYKIDETLSNLDGGIYNDTNQTITWTNTIRTTTIDRKEFNYNYNIKIKYKDIDITNRSIVNTTKGTVITENDSNEKETSFVTKNEIKGTLIVKYIDINTNKEIAEQEVYNDYINMAIVPNYKEIDHYLLAEVPSEKEFVIENGSKTLYIKYDRLVEKEPVIIKENPQTGRYDLIILLIPLVFIIYIVYSRYKMRSVFKKY